MPHSRPVRFRDGRRMGHRREPGDGKRTTKPDAGPGDETRTANISLPDEKNFPHKGRIDYISPLVDSATGTVTVRAVVKNADGFLTPGLFYLSASGYAKLGLAPPDDAAFGAGMRTRDGLADPSAELWEEHHRAQVDALLIVGDINDTEATRVESGLLPVLLGLAARHLVERRLRDVEEAALDQRRHLPEEEGQQQGADMRAVDVGVGHHDDLVIAQLRQVEIVAADASAERRDQRADLLGAQHLVEARALDVEEIRDRETAEIAVQASLT
eukprot:gene14895-19708_t